MASIYTSIYTPTTNLGPPGGSFTSIPGLSVLSVTDSFLSDGGTALINLYLGQAYGFGIDDYQFFVNITDISTNYTIISAFLGGPESLCSTVNISAIYNIPPIKSPPQLQATWTVLNTPGVQVVAPTVFSFSAQIYPAPVA